MSTFLFNRKWDWQDAVESSSQGISSVFYLNLQPGRGKNNTVLLINGGRGLGGNKAADLTSRSNGEVSKSLMCI